MSKRSIRLFRTCRFLATGRDPGAGGHYGRCLIGDAAARVAYQAALLADPVGVARIELAAVLDAIVAPILATVWEAKNRELAAGAAAPGKRSRIAELTAAGAAQVAEALPGHEDLIARADLTQREVMFVMGARFERVARGEMEGRDWDVPESFYQGLRPAVRRFFRPESELERPVAGGSSSS
ncbi:MAG: hypothetical protein NVS9B1_00570 [Candidatus Dormibacteraceae bacterium]